MIPRKLSSLFSLLPGNDIIILIQITSLLPQLIQLLLIISINSPNTFSQPLVALPILFDPLLNRSLIDSMPMPMYIPITLAILRPRTIPISMILRRSS